MEVIVASSSELSRLIQESVSRGLAEVIPEEKSAGDWLSNKEAQQYLGLSRPTLQRYRSSGKLPFSKVGGNIYYRRADIEKLLEENVRTVG